MSARFATQSRIPANLARRYRALCVRWIVQRFGTPENRAALSRSSPSSRFCLLMWMKSAPERFHSCAVRVDAQKFRWLVMERPRLS